MALPNPILTKPRPTVLGVRIAQITEALYDDEQGVGEVKTLINRHINSIPEDSRFWKITAEATDKPTEDFPLSEQQRFAVWQSMIMAFALGFSTAQIEGRMSGKIAD